VSIRTRRRAASKTGVLPLVTVKFLLPLQLWTFSGFLVSSTLLSSWCCSDTTSQGDLSHLASIFILLHKIQTTRSCRGEPAARYALAYCLINITEFQASHSRHRLSMYSFSQHDTWTSFTAMSPCITRSWSCFSLRAPATPYTLWSFNTG